MVVGKLRKIGSRIKKRIISEPFYTKDYLRKKNYDIGEHTYGKPHVYDWHEESTLKIGKYCSIARDVKIFLGGNHRTDWISTYPFPAIEKWPEARNIKGHPATKGDVIIGNDVWIGNSAAIMSGVKIGDGAVIGAFSIVTKDVAPYSIVAGNPAREVRKRFDEVTIKKLLEISWWDLPEEEIRKKIHLLCSPDIGKLDQLLKEKKL